MSNSALKAGKVRANISYIELSDIASTTVVRSTSASSADNSNVY